MSSVSPSAMPVTAASNSGSIAALADDDREILRLSAGKLHAVDACR